MTNLVRTIEDMEKLFYSQKGQAFLAQDDLVQPFKTKSDAPVTTGVTGVYQATYGAQAWIQLNQEANTFGMFAKVPWGRSGIRVITARAGSRPYGGVAEGGSIAETIKPTWKQVSMGPKTMHVPFENSEIQEALVKAGGDDAIASLDELRGYFNNEHKEDINAALNTQNGTLASNNFESIDRIIGSYAEFSNCKENDESSAYTAGDLDPYGVTAGDFDRDGGAGWTDAYVNHNSSTVRSLTDSILQAMVQNTLKNGANPAGQIIQTGYDTWATINQLYDPQVRYSLIGAKNFAGSVNGIKTLEGQAFGTQTATLFNKPVIMSKDNVQDTGGISRIYMMDTSNPEGNDIPRMCIKVLKPTQYFEAGMNNNTPFAVDKFSTKGMLRTIGELACTFYKAQGKARDLKA